MTDFIHAEQQLSAGDIVVVQCSHKCNVLVLDDSNFNSYKLRERFNYFGGSFDKFPARIQVPNAGKWNVIIDLGGGRANIRYTISYIKRGDKA